MKGEHWKNLSTFRLYVPPYFSRHNKPLSITSSLQKLQWSNLKHSQGLRSLPATGPAHTDFSLFLSLVSLKYILLFFTRHCVANHNVSVSVDVLFSVVFGNADNWHWRTPLTEKSARASKKMWQRQRNITPICPAESVISFSHHLVHFFPSGSDPAPPSSSYTGVTTMHQVQVNFPKVWGPLSCQFAASRLCENTVLCFFVDKRMSNLFPKKQFIFCLSKNSCSNHWVENRCL